MLVGPFESGFILGRLLMDSVVAIGEKIRACQRQGTKGFMWKVNFTKAYDSLDWDFL